MSSALNRGDRAGDGDGTGDGDHGPGGTKARRSGPVFNLVLGLLVGSLVSALVIDSQPDPVVVGGTAGSSPDAVGADASQASSASTAPRESRGRAASASPNTGAANPGAGDGPDGPSNAPDAAAQAAANPTGSGQPAGAGEARGVRGDAVKIGVAVPDLGALRHLGPEFDNGDPREQWEAMYDRWKREGRIPIHGRDVELVYRRFDVIDASSQRAACAGFVKDDQVFLVVGIAYFHFGSECVAREFRTPVLTSDGVAEDAYDRGHPFLFSVGMANDRVVRNMIHMGHHEGILEGKTIGVYYENTIFQQRLAERAVEGQLEALGYEVAAEHTTDQALGGPQDAVAVQKFQSAGVDLAILLTSKAGFMQQAEAQRYRPTYIESDHDFGTSDTTTARYPAEQFDGTFALTGRRDGELNAGMPLDESRRRCLDNYARYSGERPPQGGAEWAYVLVGCDLGEMLLHGLEAAGPGLGFESIVTGFETVKEMSLTRYLPATFTPSKHHGGDYGRKLRWEADCTCWKVAGSVRPLYVE